MITRFFIINVIVLWNDVIVLVIFHSFYISDRIRN